MAEPAKSENGWAPGWIGGGSLNWVDIPGALGVSMQFMKGWPTAILRAFAADYNAYVEPLYDADCASYTSSNSVWTSNHKNGTGMDMRWNSHPFRKRGTFTAAQMAVIRELLAFYEGTVFWAGDWTEPVDEMHWQMGYGSYNNPKTGDFILRKIRPDGFSTFRRGDTPTPAAADPVWVLAKATGLPTARAAEILPAVSAGLLASGCTTTARIAMWLAQVGHESVSFKYTEEIAKNGRYAPYIGRTWIQITWDYNYRAFGKWCFEQGLVTDPEVFVRDWLSLAELKWAGIGAAWYWTQARGTQINDAADRRDLNEATRLINGGYNGLSDRQTRYNLANTLGDNLLALIGVNTQLDEWDALMADNTLYPTTSAYRADDKPVLTLRDAVLQNNGMLYSKLVEDAALQGVPAAIEIVAKLASGQGPGASDAFKVEQARSIIRTIRANIAAQTGAVK
ncbi:lysin A [Mycobacterium phage Steamy]|uniref:Lysin A n=1 Tax=Mycobacterium phage Steamy TaxID=2250309 RepID=A0A345L0I4_9CAUD|nr:endolysin [Mycobacterium phage Steamy]AXH48786.1 lysin A [Mycobacterium phage Steamy]